MLAFELHRDIDVTGTSGTGVVAEGIQFSDGHTVMHWLGPLSSTAFYDSLAELGQIHGHSGNTRVVFIALPVPNPTED